MPRDYKNTTSRKKGTTGRRRTSTRRSATRRTGRRSVPGWLVLAVGVVFGLFAGLLVWLSGGDESGGKAERLVRVEPKTTSHPAAEVPSESQRVKTAPIPAKPLSSKPAASPSPTPAPPPAPTPPAEPARSEVPLVRGGKTTPSPSGNVERESEPTPPLLPVRPRFEFYTILSELETVVPPQELSSEVKEGVQLVKKPGNYMLQAGSFRTHQQADQLKARVALLGLSADIHSATSVGNEVWYRVRIGPYSDLQSLNGVRSRLKQDGIDTLLLKVSESKPTSSGDEE